MELFVIVSRTLPNFPQKRESYLNLSNALAVLSLVSIIGGYLILLPAFIKMDRLPPSHLANLVYYRRPGESFVDFQMVNYLVPNSGRLRVITR